MKFEASCSDLLAVPDSASHVMFCRPSPMAHYVDLGWWRRMACMARGPRRSWARDCRRRGRERAGVSEPHFSIMLSSAILAAPGHPGLLAGTTHYDAPIVLCADHWPLAVIASYCLSHVGRVGMRWERCSPESPAAFGTAGRVRCRFCDVRSPVSPTLVCM